MLTEEQQYVGRWIFLFVTMILFALIAGLGVGEDAEFTYSFGMVLKMFFGAILPLFNFVYTLAIFKNHCGGIDISGHWAINKAIWIFLFLMFMVWLWCFDTSAGDPPITGFFPSLAVEPEVPKGYIW